MVSFNACIKLSCIKLSSAGHQISFGFAIFPFHDHIKHIKNCSVHLAINKLALSLQYSHFMNTAIIKHHCSIPLSIKKLTFHLHRSIDRWWEPRDSPPRFLLQSSHPRPQWCQAHCRQCCNHFPAAARCKLYTAIPMKFKFNKGTSRWQDSLVWPTSISILASQGHIEEVLISISSLNR